MPPPHPASSRVSPTLAGLRPGHSELSINKNNTNNIKNSAKQKIFGNRRIKSEFLIGQGVQKGVQSYFEKLSPKSEKVIKGGAKGNASGLVRPVIKSSLEPKPTKKLKREKAVHIK